MTVSVIMPAFNAGQFIKRALLSLLSERALGLDIVVIDDGSSDDTVAVVEKLARSAPEIRLVRNAHCGVALARNTGIRSISQDSAFVTFLDADDLSWPGRIERQAKLLHANPSAGAVMGLMRLFRDGGSDRQGGRREGVVTRGISLTTILFRRSSFDANGAFDEELTVAEDADFIFRLFESGCEVLLEEEVAILYRRHTSNLTSEAERLRRGIMRAMHKSIVRRRKQGSKALPHWIDFGARDLPRILNDDTFL